MSDFPDIVRGPRRTRLFERAEERGSVVTAARHAARAAFTTERLRSSPIGRNSNGIPNFQAGTMPSNPSPVESPPPASPYGSDDGSELEDQMDFGNVQDDDLVDDDDTMDRDLGEDDLDHDEEVDEQAESDEPLQPELDPAALGLKEINNLANFGVSSHKPGNGVAELLSDDLDKYWQSDGQQPHLLTVHFVRRVEIRAIRFYVDYNQDESYTPTNIIFHAGTGPHDLTQFAEMPLVNPVGWQDVPIAGCGGGADGDSLCCFIVQMHIKENHQNGKDTHIRGLKIYSQDENATSRPVQEVIHEIEVNNHHARFSATVRDSDLDQEELQNLLDMIDRAETGQASRPNGPGFTIHEDFMRDPEIR
ncbi:galactose-binding like protein [Rhypophila decipiens]|uniref:Galactose-binding like protein n=1 Tax=Rhypophila decipiens TaxID=261697 RepID=A0AAN7BA68_9PEZI|nr:galactose-binding like protein [Rhypophila decipiens]